MISAWSFARFRSADGDADPGGGRCRAMFFGMVGLGLMSVVGALLVFAWPSVEAAPKPVLITIAAEDVPAAGDDPVRVAEGRFFLVHLWPEEGTHEFHGIGGEGGLLALSWRDPHRACTVVWRADFFFEGERGWFRNPCHGETYTKAGVRVFGPAPRSLDSFALKVEADGDIVVNTTRPTPGADDNPTRAVPYFGP
jgi:cytochrome b6-f complex iron-sulfur subunit